MILPARFAVNEDVSPLELFFDLVFVFAISQLSHHLLHHLSWRGAAETLILLVAVFGVWSYTSFEATLLHVSRSRTQWMLLAVMVLGFFMNSAITDAFATKSWSFVVPLLLIQVGRPIVTIATAPSRLLRVHYEIMLTWMVLSAPLWIVGAVAEPDSRLRWWAAAAAIDLIGTWLAHPAPRRVLHSEEVEYDAGHMLERCRLFLIIALGESVLTSGDAIAEATVSVTIVVTGASALAVIVALWSLYFSRTNYLVDRNIETSSDSILAARMALNVLLFAVAGLIAVAVGSNLVIAHPHGDATVALCFVLFGGAALYILSQLFFLRVVIGITSLPRLLGIAGLALLGALSLALPPYASILLLAALLASLVIAVRGDTHETQES